MFAFPLCSGSDGEPAIYGVVIVSSLPVPPSSDDNGLPSSPVATRQVSNSANNLPDLRLPDASKENMNEKLEPEVVRSHRAPIHPTIKKPNGAKKTGRKAGGLGVQKLTTKLCSQQLCPASIKLDRNGCKLNISIKNYEQTGYMVGSTISHALGHL